MLARMRLLGDPVLRTPAREVSDFDEVLEAQARQMVEAMRRHGGVGLAAPQVGICRRLVVVAPRNSEEVLALVNPKLTEHSAETQTDTEGCLSIPGLSIEVERPLAVRIEAQDLAGDHVDLAATGRAARILQHELDHLNGRLIVDYLPRDQRQLLADYLRRLPNFAAGLSFVAAVE